MEFEQLGQTTIDSLLEAGLEAARAAGAIIRQAAKPQPNMEGMAVQQKEGGSSYASQVVTEVDRACDALIRERLLPSCTAYDLAMLTEETEDDGGRLEKAFFWCVDPLDGTLPFVEGRPGYAVSIALVAKDGTPCIGVVYDPVGDAVYHAVQGRGAFKNGVRWVPQRKNQYLTYATDRTLKDTPGMERIQVRLEALVEEHGLDGIREMAGGGSVMNAIRVLEQAPACMMKLPKPEKGGGSLWDFAATACIFKELEMTATNCHGESLDLNRWDGAYMNHEGVFFSALP